MGANGDQGTLASQVAVKLVLQVNEGVVSVLIKVNAAENGAGEVRTNLRDLQPWERTRFSSFETGWCRIVWVLSDKPLWRR